jgi:hypothetical protein
MFVRFVTLNIVQHLRVEAGVFTVAYTVEREWSMFDYERERLRELLDWFGENLKRPRWYSIAKNPYNAICWFRPSAKEHIDKMREMVLILEDNGILIHMIKARAPGYIVYEDDFQIAAEPFASMRR